MTTITPQREATVTLTRRELANGLRALAMDAVQKANSGHPGMPMGMADIAEVLWNDFLKHNPNNPHWPNRDRFILSNGHGCMLVYALLHLSGYDLNIEEIKAFRQLHSKTPGHPEYGLTAGVETTTGPLGQGLANGVGMALAQSLLASHFNKPGYDLFNHFTYVFLGDGCLMEGISHEACSLAGTLGLGKLICFWDDNGISIDGEVEGWFTDNTPERFRAYHWHVISDIDGHDPEAVKAAIAEAQKVTDKPSLLCCKTVIGFGAPHLANDEKCHGAPLGKEEVAATRENIHWHHEPFVIPKEHYAKWDKKEKGAQWEAQWNTLFTAYEKEYPALAKELKRRLKAEFPENWEENSRAFIAKTQEKAETVASRKASLQTLEAFCPLLPEMIGGSADLTGSNLTATSQSRSITRENKEGNYIHFGVREFAMNAIANGIALHGGFIPYVGTFLTFLDYGRNAVRLAAMMHQRNIFVFTHDSIGLGEDGPTHQPVEHLSMLRATPNLSTWRPCDATETAVAWKKAIERKNGPTSLVLSRQNLPHQPRNAAQMAAIEKGAYVLFEPKTKPQGVFIATGSEVALAMQAASELEKEGIFFRVVSMPSMDVFALQEESYRESVLPKTLEKRIAIEAASPMSWYQFVGLQGKIIGMTTFGASAPAEKLFVEFGFTAEAVISAAKNILK